MYAASQAMNNNIMYAASQTMNNNIIYAVSRAIRGKDKKTERNK